MNIWRHMVVASLLMGVVVLPVWGQTPPVPPIPKTMVTTNEPVVHYFAVTAKNGAVESDFSSEVLVNNASTVKLTWDPVTNITVYVLYWGTGSRAYSNQMTVTNTTEATVYLKTNVVEVSLWVKTNISQGAWVKQSVVWQRTNVVGDLYFKLTIDKK